MTANKKTMSLFAACVILKWPETGDQEEAIKIVLNDPKISRKIEFEAKKLSDVNNELDEQDLQKEIQTLLYMSVKNEFNLYLDPTKIAGWLCSRIAWRALDHVARECDLVYSKNGNGEAEYRRVEKVTLDEVAALSQTTKATSFITAGYQQDVVSFGDMVPAGVERHPSFESFLRKCKIKTAHKHILLYILVLDYNFRQLADVYGVSSPTARKLYKKAVAALKRHIDGLSQAERDSIQNLLRGIYERG